MMMFTNRFRSRRPVSTKTSQLRRRYYTAQVCAQIQVYSLFPHSLTHLLPHSHNPLGRLSDATVDRSDVKTLTSKL